MPDICVWSQDWSYEGFALYLFTMLPQGKRMKQAVLGTVFAQDPTPLAHLCAKLGPLNPHGAARCNLTATKLGPTHPSSHIFIPPVGDHQFDAVEPHFGCKRVCSIVSKRHVMSGALHFVAVLGHSHRWAFLKRRRTHEPRVPTSGNRAGQQIHHESLGNTRQGASKHPYKMPQ